MANFNFVSSRIPASTAINVFAVDAFGNQTGSSVFSGTTGSDGSITVTGVNNSQTYVAVGGGVTVHFTVGPAAASNGISASPFVFASGRYYGVPVGSGGSVLTNQRLSVVPFFVPSTTTFDRIGLHVTTAVASSTIRLGIYGTTSNMPGSLTLDAGTIDSSTTGGKEINISQALTAGVWWLAALANGTGINTLCMTSGNQIGVGETSVANWSNNIGGYYVDTITGNLPASFGAPTGQLRALPVPVLRAA